MTLAGESSWRIVPQERGSDKALSPGSRCRREEGVISGRETTSVLGAILEAPHRFTVTQGPGGDLQAGGSALPWAYCAVDCLRAATSQKPWR